MNSQATTSAAAAAAEGTSSLTTPLDILSKEGCKVHSLTVSDQHATLLITHTVVNTIEDNGDQPTTTATTISSLLKLTLVPFHKLLLGSNPVLTLEDRQRGASSSSLPPERNLLDQNHNPSASEDILSFLQGYIFELKSESGAEYSYYSATPKTTLGLPPGTTNIDAKVDDDGCNEKEQKKHKSSPITRAAISNYGAFDVELISPASPHQISRAMPSLGSILIHETPELYNSVVKPHIQSMIDNGCLSWIQNVIEVKKEEERLLVNHADFIVNIDTKWRTHPPPLTTPREEWYNHPSTSDLYCLGIVKQYGISCLRDLRGRHAPLLHSMMTEGLSAIHSIYGVSSNQIRVFVHYLPQFYHFHVHFTRLENEFGTTCERGHLLQDVIQNLEMDSDYYCKRVMTYKLQRGTPLQNLIETYDLSKDSQ